MELPIVRLTIEHMRHEILQAFSGYVEDLKTRVAQVVDDVVKHFNYQDEIKRLAENILREKIRVALHAAFLGVSWGESLQKALAEKLIEGLKSS